MTTLLFSLEWENPAPGLAVACLNLIVALALVGVSLLLCITISLFAWLHALAKGEAQPIGRMAERRAIA